MIIDAFRLDDLHGVKVYGDDLLLPTTDGYVWNDYSGWGYRRTTGQGEGIASFCPATGLHAQIQRGNVLVVDIAMQPNNVARFWQVDGLPLDDDERQFVVWALATRIPPDAAKTWADELA